MSGSFDVCHRYITHINYWLVDQKNKNVQFEEICEIYSPQKFYALRQLMRQ